MIMVVCFGIIFFCSSLFSVVLAQPASGPCLTCPGSLPRPGSTGEGFNLSQGANQSIELFEETQRHYRMAEEDWKSKKWEHAFARYKHITEKYPSTALAGEAHMKVGLYLKYHSQWDEAINEFQKGIAIIPKTRPAHDAMTSLACIHSSRGNHDEALRLLEEVLAETRDWDQIKYCSYWIKKVRMRKESEKAGRTRACGQRL
jgi:TolA-binding protein